MSIYTGITDFSKVSSSDYKSVDQVFMHNEYSLYPDDNDIGLIRLTTKINLNINGANSVCLPAFGFESFGSETAVASGWGITSKGDTDLHSNRLKMTIIKLNKFRKHDY